MKKIYKLRDMLCEELEKFGDKPELNGSALETVDKLAHAIKNIDKVLMAEEGGSYADGGGYEGGSYDGGSYRYSRGPIYRDGGYSREGGSYNGGSYRGGSYARGRGSNAERDSMGRYSSHDRDSIEQLRQLMAEAPNDRMRQAMQSIIDNMER